MEPATAPGGGADSGKMRLAICVVYVVRPGSEWLLRLQLRKIAETTSVPYRILAVAPRATEMALGILNRRKKVDLLTVPPGPTKGSPEHAHYLDALVAEADQRGFTHFATLDMDSFPVTPHWAERLAARLGPKLPFAATLRAENGDTYLPHPSGLLCDMEFYRKEKPSFLPSRWAYLLGNGRFVLRHRQRRDTGIGYAIAAARQGGGWLPLLRSNVHNDHPLMAGIYGDTFFHLGAMSRQPLFEADWRQTPQGMRLWRTRYTGLFRGARKKLRREMVEQNVARRVQIVEALRADADAYFSLLRTGA